MASASAVDRVVVLCEDQAQRDFVNVLCESHAIRVVPNGMKVAPKGAGAGSAFVARQFPHELATLRRKSFQAGLGLLVVVDGDDQGPSRRRAWLDQKLASVGLAAVGATDPVAVLVPTWSIETWLLWLAGHSVIEATSYKRNPEVTAVTPRRALAAWPTPRPGEPASLTAARAELARLLAR